MMRGYLMFIKSLENIDWQAGKVRIRVLIVFIIVAIVIIIVAGAFFIKQRGKDDIIEEVTEAVRSVNVVKFSDFIEGGEIDKIGTIEPLKSAPLIARMGGRVTGIKAGLGQSVKRGNVIVEIDGSGEANLARVQVASTRASLVAFESIRTAALASTDSAVRITELGFDAAKAGRSLTKATVAKSREQADLAVLQAEFALSDIKDNGGADVLVRSADIGLKAARLAQDQASLARNITNRQTGDALKQAEQGLIAAKLSKERLIADLNSQRVSIMAQLASAQEQVAMAQISASINGQVNRLNVKIGDFVRPGQKVGEVIAFEGAKVTIDVTTGVRDALSVGDEVIMESLRQEIIGQIISLADAPGVEATLWQIDIVVTNADDVIHPGEQVTVKLPVGPVKSDGVFVPLDAITVRQDGVVLFTVNEQGIVEEHVVEVLGFASDFVEGKIDLSDEAMVVISGNRTLRAGEQVEVVKL
jgi:multidrug efflux pump subunit AcrA (membrane-fusion protein)